MVTEPIAHDTAHFLPLDLSDQEVSRRVFGPMQHFVRRKAWRWLFGIGLALLILYIAAAGTLLWRGVGVWGNNQTVNWGFDIINYIWWLGIGHAGTFISALLLLIERPWRHTLNRLAELMTLMAVICAALYPLLHLGRPWLFYWTMPYPNEMGLAPQYKSPTAWDMFAVVTYLLVSLMFLFIGALPDFATARDRARHRGAQVFYGVLALGWRGSQRHWALWRRATRVLAMLAVPLVFAVSSSYSFLMTMGPQSGWHSTLFPAYFVAGAVFSGFALVSLIAIGLRWLLCIEALITPRHLDMLGRLVLATGWMTTYGYLADLFIPFYSGEANEIEVLTARMAGPDAWSFWLAIICNVGVLQALWWGHVRQSPKGLASVALAVLIGMWAERYMLLIPPQTRDFLVSAWGQYSPTFWDLALFAGSFGVFLVPFSLFIRWLPMVSAFEVKQSLHRERQQQEAHDDRA